MPLAKYTSAFFSFNEASIFTADSSAESWRSVLKMLNSVSSCWKAAPVSEALSSDTVSSRPWPSPITSFLMSWVSASRSSVKSSTTLMSLANVMIAIRSDAVICVFRNFSAAAWARIWS